MNLVNHSLHHSRGMGFYCLLRRGFRDIVFGLLFLIILTGCSSSKSPIISGINQTDLTDSLPIIAPESFRDAFTATGILGAYDLIIDQTNLTGELIPKRTSLIGESFIVSGTSFFTITPCQYCLRLKNLDYDDPYIKATFYASHPFEKGNLSEPPSPKNRLDLDIFDLALVVFPLEDEPTEPHLIDIDIYSESCGYPDGYTRELSEVIDNEFACPYFLVVDDSDTGIATWNRFEMGTKDHTFDAWFAGGRFELYLTFGYGASTTFENRLAPTYYNPEFNRKAPWKVNVIPPAEGWPPLDDTETRDVIVEVYDWQIGATVDPNLNDPSDIYSQSDIVGVGIEIDMMTNELQTVTTPTGSHTGMPDDPLIFTVPIANENFLYGGFYQGYVKVLDSRIPPQAPFDGQTDSIIDVPDGVTLDFCSMPEFATYQIFTAEVWSNDPPFADLDVSDYFVDSGMPIQMWPGPATDDPDGQIILYEYDFDYRSNYFSVDASNTTGAPVTSPPFENHEFGQITQQVAMRVTDDGYPQKSTIGAETITIYPLSANRWARTWGGIGGDCGLDVAVDNAGDIYTCGFFCGEVDFNPDGGDIHHAENDEAVFITKYNSNGDYLWTFILDGRISYKAISVLIDNSGYLYVCGSIKGIIDFDPGPGETLGFAESFLAKYDTDGNFIWVKLWNNPDSHDYAAAKSLALDSNGDIIVGGHFVGQIDFDPSDNVLIKDSNGDNASYISKFNSQGDLYWNITFGSVEFRMAAIALNALDIISNEGIYATGVFCGEIDFDPDPVDTDIRASILPSDDPIFLSKFDLTGDYLWTLVWADECGGEGFDVATGSNNLVFVCGEIDSGGVDLDPGPGEDYEEGYSNDDIFVSCFNLDGNYQWGHRIGGIGAEIPYAITVTTNNNLYITGRFHYPVDFDPGPGTDLIISIGGIDAFLSKFAYDGSYLGTRTWGGDEVSGGETGRGLASSSDDCVYVTGSFTDTSDFDPSSYGTDYHTSNGSADVFLTRL